MAPGSTKKNKQVLRKIEDVIEKENECSNSPKLRVTASRVNRPLATSTLLQTLPEDNDCVDFSQDTINRPTALGAAEDADATKENNVVFGFMTPSKRKGRASLLQIAVTSSAQKRQQQQMEEMETSPAGSPCSTRKTPQKTPKRKGSPESETVGSPRTPSRRRSTLLTPKCVPKATKVDGSYTPRSRRSLGPVLASEDVTPATPRILRTRIKTRIQEEAYDTDYGEDFVSSDSDIEPDSDDDKEFTLNDSQISESTASETDEDLGIADKSYEVASKSGKKNDNKDMVSPLVINIRKSTRRKRVTKLEDDDEEGGETVTDDYFLHNDANSRVVTSDHTLSKLSVPRLSGQVLKSIISDSSIDHCEERQALLDEHCLNFDKWRTLLGYGYSIFVHGVGSKKNLISKFHEQMLSSEDHIVINGFFPSLTMKSVLNCILEEILCLESYPCSTVEQIEVIYSHYSQPSVNPLYIIVHNIDGPMLRSSSVQMSLSHLCSLRSIRLVASVDHINAPILLDSKRLSEYNALWFDCTTLAPYTEETSYENSLMVQQSSSLALSSLIHVFKSLTPCSQGIFILLAKYQMENRQDQSYNGLSFADLYKKCREKMLVNSDLALRAQLTEYTDHKLLKQRKGFDGAEMLIIPLDSATLQEFVDQQSQAED